MLQIYLFTFMGILTRFFSSASISKSHSPAIYESVSLKGEVVRFEERMSGDLGESHLYDLEVLENLYKNFGLLGGIVDKYVDFVVGVGFFVKSENKEAKELIEKFLIDTQFDYLLRLWLKESMIKGTGYLEMGGADNSSSVPTDMKILDSKWVFIKRDKYGVVEKINQLKLSSRGQAFNSLNSSNFTSFNSNEVAVFNFNVVGNSAYGTGIIAPTLNIINNLLGIQKDMNTLLHRKANAPIHAKIGNEQYMPDPGAVSDFGQKLETMQAKTEFTTDWLVDMKVLDFGQIGEKFEFALKHYEDLIFFSVQIPEVIMGRGNIAEGIAKVQMTTFERRIQSIQAELEKVIEQTIFKRILSAKGLEDVHVEFEWGIESATEKNERVTKITNLLNIAWTSPQLRKMLEFELAELLGLNVNDLDKKVDPPQFATPPLIPKGSEPKQDDEPEKDEEPEENEEEGIMFRISKK